MVRYIRILFLLSLLCFLLYPIKDLVSQKKFKDFFTEENALFTSSSKDIVEKLYQFPQKIDACIKESFLYKNSCYLLYRYIWEGVFAVPVLYNATGKNGEGIPSFRLAPVLENYLGVYPLTPKELVSFQLYSLGMYTFFQLHNIEYLFVTIPDKPTVYPDILPFWADWCKGENHYTQRVAVLEQLSIPWIDMLEVFKKNPSQKVYSKKVDPVHWNCNGQVLAYEEVYTRLAKIDPLFPTQPIGTCFTVVDKDFPYITEVDLFLFKTPAVEETIPYIKFLNMDQFEPIKTDIFSEDNLYGWDQSEVFTNKKSLSNKTILLAGDSYTIGPYAYEKDQVQLNSFMFPIAYHAKNFYKLHYTKLSSSTLKTAFKNGYKPDIVILAFCERIRSLPQINDMLFMTLGDIALNNSSTILLTPETIHAVIEDTPDTKVTSTKTKATLFHKTNPPTLQLKPIYSGTDGRITLILRSPTIFGGTFNIFWENEDNQRGTVPVQPTEELIHVLFFTKPNQKIRIRLELYNTKEQTILLPMPEEVLLLQTRQK